MNPIYIILSLALGFTFAYFLFKKKDNTDNLSEEIINKLNQKFPEILNQANQNLVTLANQNLDSKKAEIATDLANKNQNFEKLVDRVLKELEKNQKKLELSDQDRVGSFNRLSQQMNEYQKLYEKLQTTTEGLKKVLSNNQLRGAFGEKVAEDLLKMAGFVRGVDYQFNKEQGSTETRPDFSIYLPDGAIINVDSKFPYSNLSKMTEAENKEDKEFFQKAFERDVREKIKQASSRGYIDTDSNTVDFVIVFIPNEMIFSFIYDKMPHIWQEALEKKVVLAGPFSFTAILRMVRQAYDNFKIQKNTKEIIKYIKKFSEEFEKYNVEFEKIGSRLDAVTSQYDKVNTTRTRQLLKVVDQISLESTAEANQTKLIS